MSPTEKTDQYIKQAFLLALLAHLFQLTSAAFVQNPNLLFDWPRKITASLVICEMVLSIVASGLVVLLVWPIGTYVAPAIVRATGKISLGGAIKIVWYIAVMVFIHLMFVVKMQPVLFSMLSS